MQGKELPERETPSGAQNDPGPGDPDASGRGPRRTRYVLLATAASTAGSYVVYSLVPGSHGFGLAVIHLPHALGTSLEVAGVFLLSSAVAVVALVVWCIIKAIRDISSGDMANRWIDL